MSQLSNQQLRALYSKGPQLNFSDVNQDILLVCAFRYALWGRQTYVVGAITDIIKANWVNIPKDRRAFYKREIHDVVKMGFAGSEVIDVPAWKSILDLPDGE